LTIESGSQ